MSPAAWRRVARAIEGPSEALDRLCLWAWRGCHRAEQRQAARAHRARRQGVTSARPGRAAAEVAGPDGGVPAAR
ncbi:MAG: hypothetical protein AB7O29_11235 [Acidimicrobiia bacterium]